MKERSGKPRRFAKAVVIGTMVSSSMLTPIAVAKTTPPKDATEIPAANWPESVRPADDAPNFLVIMTDDVGFAASSTFGGPVPTPTFDALAARGLKFNRFHTTAICSASRAALLTGRNHTAVGVGNVIDTPQGLPGFNSSIPPSAATLPEVLRENGYRTSCFGKWHLVPKWEQGPTGPFDRWPTGMGCETFYGFIQGDTNQWAPALYSGTTPVEPPMDDPTYILDRDLADKAVQWLRTQKATDPSRPFFMYIAPGTAHAPHHAPKEWIKRFEGRFSQGWDVMRQQILDRQIRLGVVPPGTELTPMPDGIARWSSLSSDQRKIYERQMEVFAAALAYADNQLGRVIEELRADGRLENTLIVYIQGDNGSSTEGGENGTLSETAILNRLGGEDVPTLLKHIDDLGGPNALNHYATGWALALNTPFQWTKLIASHFGGTRNGMVVSWPKGIARQGEVRSQFTHLIDVMPTILEAARINPPAEFKGVKQQDVDGTSMLYAFNDAKAPERHKTQFFSISGNLAIYKDGWVAATKPDVAPWNYPLGLPMQKLEDRQWELYDTRTDFSQATDLAKRYPARLDTLIADFYTEARRNKALPVMRSGLGAKVPNPLGDQLRFEFRGKLSRIPATSAPDLLNRSFSITADIEFAPGQGNGVLVAQGGRFGGYSLFMNNGRVFYEYNMAGRERTSLSGGVLSPGKHKIKVRFDYDGGGIGRGGGVSLEVDGKSAGLARVERTMPLFYSLDETFDLGIDTGTSVSRAYQIPFPFEGEINMVGIDLENK